MLSSIIENDTILAEVYSLDNSEAVEEVPIDLNKAFDSVCHNPLLAKLIAYGFTNDAVLMMSLLVDLADRRDQGSICPRPAGLPYNEGRKERCDQNSPDFEYVTRNYPRFFAFKCISFKVN